MDFNFEPPPLFDPFGLSLALSDDNKKGQFGTTSYAAQRLGLAPPPSPLELAPPCMAPKVVGSPVPSAVPAVGPVYALRAGGLVNYLPLQWDKKALLPLAPACSHVDEREGVWVGPHGKFLLGGEIVRATFNAVVRQALSCGQGGIPILGLASILKRTAVCKLQFTRGDDMSDEMVLWRSIPRNQHILLLEWSERILLNQANLPNRMGWTRVDVFLSPLCDVGTLVRFVNKGGLISSPDSQQVVQTRNVRRHRVTVTGLPTPVLTSAREMRPRAGSVAASSSKRRGVALSVAKDVMAQLPQGVRAFDDHGMVHNDIKPDNILGTTVEAQESSTPCGILWRLGDFGLAQHVDTNMSDVAMKRTPPSGRDGSVSYMTPEVLSADAETCRGTLAADMWALGCVLYVLNNGSPPFLDGLPCRLQTKVRAAKWDMPAWLCRRKLVPGGQLSRTSGENQVVSYAVSVSDDERDVSWDGTSADRAEVRQALSGLLDPNPATRWDIHRLTQCAWLTAVQ